MTGIFNPFRYKIFLWLSRPGPWGASQPSQVELVNRFSAFFLLSFLYLVYNEEGGEKVFSHTPV